MSVLSFLQRYQFGILALAIVALAGGLVAERLLAPGPAGIEFAYGSALEPGSPIRVQVAGAVARPGIYDLREGDRVVDAIAAAGGPASGADLDGLNLARRVRDEERLVVPGAVGPSTSALGAAVTDPAGKININVATEKQLDALPGIGEAYSRRIVDSRKIDGPYKTTRDLVDRKVIPAGTYEQIRDMISVGP